MRDRRKADFRQRRFKRRRGEGEMERSAHFGKVSPFCGSDSLHQYSEHHAHVCSRGMNTSLSFFRENKQKEHEVYIESERCKIVWGKNNEGGCSLF